MIKTTHSPSAAQNAAQAALDALARRQQAERLLHDRAAASPGQAQDLSPQAMRQSVHELQVHQIELEMQNEELRRAQLDLDASRERYFDLYDLAPVAYCTVDEHGLIQEANFAAAKLLGLARSTLAGQRISRFIAKAYQDTYYLYNKRMFAKGEPQAFELQMSKSDGANFWVNMTTTFAHDSNGAPVQRMVLNDVTDAKIMAAAMQGSEARYRAMVEWSPDAIVVHRDGKIIYANPATATMFGAKSPQELLGRPLMDSVHPDYRAVVQARVKNVTRLGNATSPVIEEVLLKLDGTPIDVEVQNIATVFDDAPAIQVTMRNITERRQGETERQLLTAALQEKNKELSTARQVADKANQAKTDFLSSMSHELRTPLSAILGFAQLIESGTPAPTPSQKRSIGQILQAGWYLLDLINEILDLALIESGKLSLSMEPTALDSVLRECEAMIGPLADTRGIRVSFSARDTAYSVNADHRRMKQVLVNLLSNAIKYNKVGGTVSVICVAVAPQRIRISVKDSGNGLTQNKIAQLFQPFNRLGREASTEEGTGIGLVMTKRLVEMMGGEIGVQSTVGTGSVFWVEMNLIATPPSFADADADADADATAFTAPLRTVLYVEDNPANLMLVQDLMARHADIRLLTATDALSGVALARAERPDVIVMDINLPGISGLEALKILLADSATSHMPVVALSANAIPEDIERGLAAGFFRYLTKPLKVNELMLALDAACSFAQASSAARQAP